MTGHTESPDPPDPLSFSSEELQQWQEELRREDASRGAAPDQAPPVMADAQAATAAGAMQAACADERGPAPSNVATVYRFPGRGGALRASVLVAIAKAIAAGERHDQPSAPTARGIHAKTQQLRQRLMREAGIKPIRIPKQADKLRCAVVALLGHVGAGKKPSALRAAWEAGAAGEQSKKLAYRVKVKREDVDAGLCLIERTSPFVQRLRADKGLLHIVLTGHPSLAALARVLAHAHESLAARASLPDTATDRPPRGGWHDEARALRAAGWTGNRIARHLGLNVKTVESFLARDRRRSG